MVITLGKLSLKIQFGAFFLGDTIVQIFNYIC